MISESRNLAYRIDDYEQQIALLKSDLKALERQVLTDPLTGLGNRKDLELRLIELAVHARARGRHLSLLMIDVDHFKDLNDAFGHQTGDEILRIVARIFRSRLKGRDIPCRYGGDEFAIILPETGLAQAIQVGEGLRQALAARPLVNKRCGARFGPVTLSIGAAELRGAEPPEELLHRSDIALYRAKRDGRNRVRPEAPPTENHA
jgi:diguanylate cyclase